MPVVQKTGPDGCLYILDWYDRYHCYQDANRDPEGIDRLKGRLYRVRYEGAPHAAPFDLKAETDDQLIARLSSPNVFFRDIAQRLLAERNRLEARAKLEMLVLNADAPMTGRMHALWSLIGAGPLDADFHLKLLASDDASLRAWAVRAAGNAGQVDAAIAEKVVALTADESPIVRLQVAIAAGKLEATRGENAIPIYVKILAGAGDDKLLPHIVWQNLHPLLETHSEEFLAAVKQHDLKSAPALAKIMPRVTERILAAKKK
jgi:hypothetical protein